MSKHTSISNRIHIGFTLLVVFLPVFVTNRLYNRHANILMSTFEIVFLILIGLLMQFDVFYKIKSSRNATSNTTD